jgi:hypothetical protein
MCGAFLPAPRTSVHAPRKRRRKMHTQEPRAHLRAAFTTGCTFSPSSVTMMNWMVYNISRGLSHGIRVTPRNREITCPK